MGACYSKNAAEAVGTNGNTAKPKFRISKRSKKKIVSQEESVPLQQHQENIENRNITSEEIKDESDIVPANVMISRSSTPDLEQEIIEKLAEYGVAPSDSGIESIGAAPEEAQETVQIRQKRDELSKRLERLSRGSCHKCGNFKLDDSALTALLADTYCLCGPRQAGRPSVNPQCQTHGAQRYRKPVSSVDVSKYSPNANYLQAYCASSNSSDQLNRYSDDLGLKSSLKKAGSARKDKDRSLRISTRSGESLDIALALLNSVENDNHDISEQCADEQDSPNSKAPLAKFDSLDTSLNNTHTQKMQKRRSLLSEILDITDSICKCDFYSNEFCCAKDHDSNGVLSASENNVHVPVTTNGNLSFQNGHENETSVNNSSSRLSHSRMGTPNNSHACLSRELLTNPDDQFNSPSKKSCSLPKNVSFAATDETDDEHPVSAAKVLSLSSPQKSADVSVSEGSSGIYSQSHNSASESHLTMNGLRKAGTHQRSSSLGSRGVLLSDSSSEALDGGTEDDMASLDLDSVSRVTSLSYNSIRQLVESTEDLVSPLDMAKRMKVDGVDCVIIPTDTYRQMQADLDTLKQQLICLSSLIQEEAENLALQYDSAADTSITSVS